MTFKIHKGIIILILISVIATVFIYSSLPEKIPIHWGIKGEVDSLGILFIVIGNYMGQIRPNYTFGIRIPWTLADETVWKKPHRVWSFAFILCGFLFIVAGIINKPYSFYLAMSSLFIVIICIFIYSYLEYKKIHR